MRTTARLILRVLFGIAVLSGLPQAARKRADAPTAVPESGPRTAVSVRCAPVSPRSFAFHLTRPAGRLAARPKPVAGGASVAAVVLVRPVLCRLAARPAAGFYRSTGFVGFFLRLVLGHLIAAQAP